MATIASPEATHAIPIAVVPFSKARWMVAELIASRTNIPRLSDQLHTGENGILAKRVVKSGVGVEPIRFASERRAEIKAKPIDMSRRHPGCE